MAGYSGPEHTRLCLSVCLQGRTCCVQWALSLRLVQGTKPDISCTGRLSITDDVVDCLSTSRIFLQLDL